MIKLLRELSEAHGISGSEEEVANIMKRELEKVCDEVFLDNMGNLIARRGKGKRTVLLDAHMDEIGFMVKNIDKEGFIKFVKLGGFYDPTILNQRVIVHSKGKRYSGVIGSKPPHLMKEAERKKPIEAKDMFIDIGAKDAKQAGKMGVEVGDYITIDRSMKELDGDLVTGKAFDNRIGCLVMIEVMKKIETEDTVYAVGAVQEEVGLKGARTAAFRINPDYALALDVTTTGDYPGVTENESSNKVGKGPVITVVDSAGRGLITHPKIKKLLIDTAKKNKIPYQLEVGDGGTTDATAIHLTREGIPTGVLSVPTRYIHSPVEVASMKDIKNSIKLITLAVNKGI